MYFKLIACDVLTREVSYCIARTPHTVDVEFTEKGQHEDSERLRLLLQPIDPRQPDGLVHLEKGVGHLTGFRL